MKNTDFLSQNINWNETGDAFFPYEAVVDGKELSIRINDFPEEHLYTLLVDGEEVCNFDDWLENWNRNSEENYYEEAETLAR